MHLDEWKRMEEEINIISVLLSIQAQGDRNRD